MVKLYADLCEQGLRTLKEDEGIIPVPLKWHNAVVNELINRNRQDLVK